MITKDVLSFDRESLSICTHNHMLYTIYAKMNVDLSLSLSVYITHMYCYGRNIPDEQEIEPCNHSSQPVSL